MSNNFHEKEVIKLSASSSKSRQELHKFLKKEGYTSEDEFYFLDRTDKSKPWQSISIVTLDVFNQGCCVHETEEDVAERFSEWDELRVDYPLATLPSEFIVICAARCESIAAQFDLQIEFGGKILETGELKLELQKIADKLAEEWDKPGEETLRILIEQCYGR